MTARSASILVASFLLIALAQPARHAEGETRIHLDYPDALLILDEGEETCRGKASVSMEAGRHTLTLYPPARDAQWLPPVIARPFELADGESLVIRPEGVHYLYISSIPSGAKIRLNASVAGNSPLALSIVTATDSTITLEQEGFVSRTLSLSEALSQGPHIVVVMDPVAGREVSPLESGVRDNSAFGLPGWFPGATLAYFIASTAVGFHYKARADELYEDYLSTSSIDRMNNLFERAEAMDDRARLFWVTGQAALGTTIYFFIQNYRSRKEERPVPAIQINLSPREGGSIAISFR